MVNLELVQISSDLSVPTKKIILVCFEYFPPKKNCKEDWQLPNTTSVLPVLQQEGRELENNSETKVNPDRGTIITTRMSKRI